MNCKFILFSFLIFSCSPDIIIDDGTSIVYNFNNTTSDHLKLKLYHVGSLNFQKLDVKPDSLVVLRIRDNIFIEDIKDFDFNLDMEVFDSIVVFNDDETVRLKSIPLHKEQWEFKEPYGCYTYIYKQ